MKGIISQMFLVLFFNLIIISCEEGTESETKQAEIFEIHLQSWFTNNPVQVEFDNEIVFDDTISTGSILAVASIISLDVSQGKHNIKVVVNNNIQGDTTLIVGDNLYVGVNYNSDQKIINFHTQKRPFPYR